MPIRLIRIFLSSLSIALVFATIYTVPLIPEVNRNFFLSEGDLQFEHDRDIARMFGTSDLIIASVEGKLDSAGYLERIRELSSDLLKVTGVRYVKNLSVGPDGYSDAIESPLWRSLLISPQLNASNIVITVRENNFTALIPGIVSVTDSYNAPDFKIRLSGVPYLIERVKHFLLLDLKTFTALCALLVVTLSAYYLRSLTSFLFVRSYSPSLSPSPLHLAYQQPFRY